MREVSLANGDTLLRFDPSGDTLTPSVCVQGESGYESVIDGARFLTLEIGASSIPVHITAVNGGGDALNFAGRFPGLDDWQMMGEVHSSGDMAPRFDWRIRLTYVGDDVAEYRVRVHFDVRDTGEPRWMIPAMFYEHNRPANSARKYPRYAVGQNDPQEFVSDYWAFRADRSSCPSVFCWTDKFTSCLATAESFGDIASGLAFKGDDSGISLMLNFPYVEEPVKYSICRDDGIAPDRPLAVMLPHGQVELAFSTYVAPRDLHAYDNLIRDIYDDSEGEPNPWVTKQEADELLSYGLYNWHYDSEHHALYETCAFDSYFAKFPHNVERPHMHVSWVSGIPYAYALWRYGQEHDEESYANAGISVIDKIAGEGLSPSGLFYAEWTLESGWGTGWNPNSEWLQARTAAEATWFLLQALEFGKKQGFSRPSWEAAARSNLDTAIRVQRDDGNFGSYYNVRSGNVEEWDGAAGLMWIPALLAGSRYFNDGKYKLSAVKAGKYYSKFVENEYIYGAPEDVHLGPTSEDGYNAVIAYLHLYEATDKDSWLDLACSAADWATTFRWIYNTPFPESTILHEYDFRTIGGDAASPANNHLHNYGLICLPEFLRLWAYTGDTYYLSRVADHLAFSHQFIAREDGDFNARKGMITEQWYHTDWTHAKGSMLQLAHCWCAGLLLYANAYTREFGEIVIDADSREVFVLDSPWIKSTEEMEPDLILTLVNPSSRDLRLSVRHSKLGVVGHVDIGGLEEARVRIGGSVPEVEMLTLESEVWQ
jgi:hypothetical protein